MVWLDWCTAEADGHLRLMGKDSVLLVDHGCAGGPRMFWWTTDVLVDHGMCIPQPLSAQGVDVSEGPGGGVMGGGGGVIGGGTGTGTGGGLEPTGSGPDSCS